MIRCEKGFLVKLTLQMVTKMFAPGDTIKEGGNLHIIHRGVALFGAKLLGRGDAFGEDVLLKGHDCPVLLLLLLLLLSWSSSSSSSYCW